jgi:hypothetical protein
MTSYRPRWVAGNSPLQRLGQPMTNLIATGTVPKYPNVRVKLVGKDAQAFSIVGTVAKAMDEAGVPRAEVDLFMHAAMAGDYDHMLRTVTSWVRVH